MKQNHIENTHHAKTDDKNLHMDKGRKHCPHDHSPEVAAKDKNEDETVVYHRHRHHRHRTHIYAPSSSRHEVPSIDHVSTNHNQIQTNNKKILPDGPQVQCSEKGSARSTPIQLSEKGSARSTPIQLSEKGSARSTPIQFSKIAPARSISIQSSEIITQRSTSSQGCGKAPQLMLKARAIVSVNQPDSGDPYTGMMEKPVCGEINFEQTSQGVHITGYIKGLGKETSHGFHIHEFGDVGSCCGGIGEHFNPLKRAHGGPNDAERHLGDLGNITTNSCGKACIDILDPMISLQGEHSIVGRSIAIDAMPDDMNHGRDKEVVKTGYSTERLACGTIVLVDPQAP